MVYNIPLTRELIRTRADSLDRRGIEKYRRNTGNSSKIKNDWICKCKRQNFQRNKNCRSCGIAKELGLVRTVEVDLEKIHDRQKDKNDSMR